MQRHTFLKLLSAAALASLGLTVGASAALAQTSQSIPFFYPVNVGGPINKIVDDFASDFNASHPGARIEPIYSGNYQETLVKALTGFKSGTPPVTAVLLSTDMYTLIDEDAIVPFDGFIKTDADRAWLNGFYPAFMKNSQAEGKTWGIPFQRSTVVIYWNKDLFKEAGLDPDKGPSNWQELRDYAQKLTKKDARGNVTTWGVQIPSSGFPYWMFQTLTTPNDVELINDRGTAVNLDNPKSIEALQYWVDLTKDGLHPKGVVEWGTTPKDFFEKKAAIIVTTTGNLTNIRNNAGFDFGVGPIPGNRLKGGSPTGGGNFYIFKKTTPEQQQAAFDFIRWVTTPERAAQWSIDTGYAATSQAAYDTEVLNQYGKEFPAALVARDQLPISVAEFSTYDNQRVTKVLNDALQAALTGSKTPEKALQDAQQEATRLLRAYQ